MDREAVVFGSSVVALVVGLAILLVGEAVHDNTFVSVGGLIGLISVAVITAAVATLPEPSEHDHE